MRTPEIRNENPKMGVMSLCIILSSNGDVFKEDLFSSVNILLLTNTSSYLLFSVFYGTFCAPLI